MKVVFSNRAYTTLVAETYEKIKTETGGVFLGFYENDTWYVVETIDPGPKSIFQIAYFEYDQCYVTHLINKVARIYKKNLKLIGLWHRHPGSFDRFSGTDDQTNLKYAKISNYGAISGLVNIDPIFRLTIYHVDYPLRYKKIQYEVGDNLFPDHSLEVIDYKSILDLINYGYISEVSKFNTEKRSLVEVIERSIKKMKVKEYDDEELLDVSEDYYEEMIDIILEDLDYISNEKHIKIKTKRQNRYLVVQDYNDSMCDNLYFTKLGDQYGMCYKGIMYNYIPGLLKKLNEEKIEVYSSIKTNNEPIEEKDNLKNKEKEICEKKDFNNKINKAIEKIKNIFQKSGEKDD